MTVTLAAMRFQKSWGLVMYDLVNIGFFRLGFRRIHLHKRNPERLESRPLIVRPFDNFVQLFALKFKIDVTVGIQEKPRSRRRGNSPDDIFHKHYLSMSIQLDIIDNHANIVFDNCQ